MNYGTFIERCPESHKDAQFTDSYPGMTILEVIDKYDAGTLFDATDESLYIIQMDIDNQVNALLNDWNLSLFPADVRTVWHKLQEISTQITATLNTRYGCND